MISQELGEHPDARPTRVLRAVGVATSSWYDAPTPAAERRRRGPAPKAIQESIEKAVVAMAESNPWYGYKRIAVMCRRAGVPVSNRQCFLVMKRHDLLQKPPVREAEAYQAARLFELLPERPNELWQTDVTYVHIPGAGWWYVVTVIDYFSRYLLCAYLTNSYSAAEATEALKLARAEAERIHGPLTKAPFLVTDNGTSFTAKRFKAFLGDDYSHVRIAYRTPTQLGLLERFHRTLKEEEVYWRIYEDPAHARRCLAEFRERYNERRPHWALTPVQGGDVVTPVEVYRDGVAVGVPRWQGWAVAAKKKLEEVRRLPAA
jgi:transposase InsO family protein